MKTETKKPAVKRTRKPKVKLLKDNPRWTNSTQHVVYQGTILSLEQTQALGTQLDYNGDITPAIDSLTKQFASAKVCGRDERGMEGAQTMVRQLVEIVKRELAR